MYHVVDVFGEAGGVVQRSVPIGVGRPDVDVVAVCPGHDEYLAPVGSRRDDGRDVRGESAAGNSYVDSLRRSKRVWVGLLVEGPHVVSPHARGVYDDRGTYLDLCRGRPGRTSTRVLCAHFRAC